jgi:uncharacterized protein YyaL (SSP411 family)
MNFQRNNLDLADSPYLRQHKDNPIWWQDWNNEVLSYALQNQKLIFVSSGYSTCHWCHVMAADSFSNLEIANELNKNFVCIKIDREIRPDIDHFLMEFMNENYGSGGWPLNVILTPDKKPFFAGTYIGSEPRYGMPSFLELLEKIQVYYLEKKDVFTNFQLKSNKDRFSDSDAIESTIINYHDKTYGGFGQSMKFPPHNTLLFLIHLFEENQKPEFKEIITKTLDSIALYGLHDHLQGGFYRYCVDRAWSVPHFEKMLYDQAMLLMVYSAAAKVLKNENYEIVAKNIIECLNQTFEIDGLFCSAFDADTNHHEGLTYLWSDSELIEILGDKLSKFNELYEMLEFEGKGHLHKKSHKYDNEIEKLLLDARRKKEQPFRDDKILTSWNSILGIGFIYAFRTFHDDSYLEIAKNIYKLISEKLSIDGDLYHSMLDSKLSGNGFLEDYASFLLFITFLSEETEIEDNLISRFKDKLLDFKINNIWYESINSELGMIPAKDVDHPTPSSISMAEMALLRSRIILGEDYSELQFKEGTNFDFYNLAVLLSQGMFNQFYSIDRIKWQKLPINTMQIIENHYANCYKGRCDMYSSMEEMESQMLK